MVTIPVTACLDGDRRASRLPRGSPLLPYV